MDCRKIKEGLGENWIKFEETYRRSLVSDNGLITTINEHLLSNPGKMIRPMLSLLSADCCGKINNESIICAVTSEIMHTASLMHDDVTDNSDLRRGVPTIKKLFSPAASVLMGDFWLSRAIKYLLVDNIGYEILHCFAKALEDLSIGELLQMERAADLDITEREYEEIIARKTASLFVASIKSAVLSVYRDDNSGVPAAFEEFAYYFGVAFQIKDDILDYSPDKNIGKPICADIAEHKITLPLIGAIKNAQYDSRSEDIEFIMKRIESINESPDEEVQAIKSDVLSFIKQYDGLNYAQNELIRCIDKAIDSLNTIPDSHSRQMLIELAKSLSDR